MLFDVFAFTAAPLSRFLAAHNSNLRFSGCARHHLELRILIPYFRDSRKDFLMKESSRARDEINYASPSAACLAPRLGFLSPPAALGFTGGLAHRASNQREHTNLRRPTGSSESGDR